MAKTDLGDKQVCPGCGAKFYDLRKRPAVCPKCTTAFDPAEEGVRTKRGRSRVAANETNYEDDEELEKKKKTADADDDEDGDEAETEEAVEIDAEVEAEPVVAEDDDEEKPKSEDELPEGFSEEEADLGEDAGDDEGVPMLEDEEEFSEDEIGELPAGEDEGS